MNQLNNSIYLITQIGHEFCLWLLLLLSLLSFSFILERYIFLSKIKQSCDEVLEKIKTMVDRNDFSKIKDINQDSSKFMGQVLFYAISHIENHGSKGLNEIFDIYEATQRDYLEKYLNFLATVGSNAPFIGLLGTVFGVIDSFKQLSMAQVNPSAVMSGLSQALIATALGLFVAIPAVVCYNIFQKKNYTILKGLKTVKTFCLAYCKVKQL